MTVQLTPHELLEMRILWARNCLATEIARGRRFGYLPGPELAEVPDAAAVRDEITERLRETRGLPVQRLAAAFALTDPEQDVLWLLACCEIEPRVSALADAITSAGVHQLGAQHVKRLLDVSGATLSRLARLGLIELDADVHLPGARRGVRATDRVVDLISGIDAIDPALDGIATIETPTRSDVTEAPAGLVRALARTEPTLVVVTGTSGSGRAEIAKRAAAALGHPLMIIRCDRLAPDENALSRQLRAIARDCVLAAAYPLFLDADVLLEHPALLERELFSGQVATVLATAIAAPRCDPGCAVAIHPVAALDPASRGALWRHHLDGADPEVIATCASRYSLSRGAIAETCTAALDAARSAGDLAVDHVQRVLRDRLDRRLSGFARRIEWKQRWEDLVLPADQVDQLIEMVARVRHREQVLSRWGFADKVGKGHGTSALFSGPPGTGKTMIAGLLARELGLDLYQVDLSKVVSKYIGETEKQLAALFEAAECGQAILLFDEADALFAKRTEVKSSNDRYANLEVNYLLQRLESFEGICILTTNHESAIDEAFLRRLAFHVRMPLPDDEHRELLWRALIPATAEVALDLDLAMLARELVMSGGYIKNAVLRAAYLAADQRTPITNALLWRAARAEYEAMGKVTVQPRIHSAGARA